MSAWFVTEFPADELFPPGLENATGRTRQFVSYARSAGLLAEDRGSVELTDLGKRYVRSSDPENVFDISEGQAEWLLRSLRERHMTDSIYHGVAIGLSLFASNPPDFRVSKLDFGRALAHLGRAGWDNENTLASQGERYRTLLEDLGLIDDDGRLTAVGTTTKSELTLPIHMSLRDLAGQLNPGGIEAATAEGDAERAGAASEPEPVAAAETPEPEPEADYEDEGDSEWEDVRGTAEPPPAAPPPAPPPPPPAPERPVPPADLWETAAPEDPTSPHPSVAPEVTSGEPLGSAPVEAPAPAAQIPDVTGGDPVGAAAVATPPATAEPADVTSGDPLASPPTAAAPPPAVPEPPPPPPPPPPPAAPARPASGFLDPALVKSAAEGSGLRLPDGVYANAVAALASGRHLLITGPPGSGKTELAVAIAKAAAKSGRSSGAALVTPSGRWSARDTVGRVQRPQGGPASFERGHVLAAAEKNRWLIVDELDRAELDRALGGLSSFLGGLPLALPDGSGEATAPRDWRLVATHGGSADPSTSPALLRRFAHVELRAPDDAALSTLIDEASGGDTTAAGAIRKLLALRELRDLGAGPFLDAARHAAERNALTPASGSELARECLTAYFEPHLRGLDANGQARLRELTDAL